MFLAPKSWIASQHNITGELSKLLWKLWHGSVITSNENPWNETNPWRHQMETFSALLSLCAGNSPVTSEFSTQRPVTRSFEVFFDLRLNKRLSKQSWGWWFETPLCSLWRHCNTSMVYSQINNFSERSSIRMTWIKKLSYDMIYVFIITQENQQIWDH